MNKFGNREEILMKKCALTLVVFTLVSVAVSAAVIILQLKLDYFTNRVMNRSKYSLDCALFSSSFSWCYL